ncbi:MAG: N-acetylmuramoyl-L-alanine amidase [Deltaproteobacteria bacterium]|nr:N-acetylmuramoyl-L-alanine amidase [Deltaproteobacteria bacterium]
MRRRLHALVLGLAALGLLGVERPPGLGDVVDVRHWSYPNYTRVVVELDRSVKTEVRRLAADPAAGRSERLYLDLAGVWVGRDYAEGISLEDGLLRSVRLGQNTLRTTRVVLDLQRYDRHRLLELTHPHRIVIDVYGTRGAGGSHGRGRPPRGAALPSGLRPIRTVVIDPGHGGRDPGAIGVGGLREKDLTLRLAKALGAQLEEKGFRVIYTRRDDRYISLEERSAIAESVEGDLFLSLHMNASRNRSAHGIETYYLDKNHERHALDLAARENGISLPQVNILQQTLAMLHIEELSPYSQQLAQAVQGQVVRGLPRRQRPQDLGVKKGPFYVLFLANMPAILVEAGFISNRGEAKRLRDKKYLARFAAQMAIGVEHYRGEQETRLAGKGRR